MKQILIDMAVWPIRLPRAHVLETARVSQHLWLSRNVVLAAPIDVAHGLGTLANNDAVLGSLP